MIHLKTPEGKAKCGSVPWNRYSWNFQLSDDKSQVNCKRCLGTVVRKNKNAPVTENMIGKILHTSWGYDMTINEYVKVIKQTNKSLTVAQCFTSTNGNEYNPGGGTAVAGIVDPGGKVFNVFKRDYGSGNVYWVGKLHSSANCWSEWDGKPDYENHLD